MINHKTSKKKPKGVVELLLTMFLLCSIASCVRSAQIPSGLYVCKDSQYELISGPKLKSLIIRDTLTQDTVAQCDYKYFKNKYAFISCIPPYGKALQSTLFLEKSNSGLSDSTLIKFDFPNCSYPLRFQVEPDSTDVIRMFTRLLTTESGTRSINICKKLGLSKIFFSKLFPKPSNPQGQYYPLFNFLINKNYSTLDADTLIVYNNQITDSLLDQYLIDNQCVVTLPETLLWQGKCYTKKNCVAEQPLLTPADVTIPDGKYVSEDSHLAIIVDNNSPSPIQLFYPFNDITYANCSYKNLTDNIFAINSVDGPLEVAFSNLEVIKKSIVESQPSDSTKVYIDFPECGSGFNFLITKPVEFNSSYSCILDENGQGCITIPEDFGEFRLRFHCNYDIGSFADVNAFSVDLAYGRILLFSVPTTYSTAGKSEIRFSNTRFSRNNACQYYIKDDYIIVDKNSLIFRGVKYKNKGVDYMLPGPWYAV